MSAHLTFSEIREKYQSSGDCVVVIDGNIYNVTEFLEKHPGGAEILMEYACCDASQAFGDVGHSQSAKDMLQTFLIGTLNEESQKGSHCYERSTVAEIRGKDGGDSADAEVSTSASGAHKRCSPESCGSGKYLNENLVMGTAVVVTASVMVGLMAIYYALVMK
ncbi:hypothetical protein YASMINEVIRUS_1018 [Yasminevirus sp. GU-2018]|uniref:Cytochrome b5 heme-binding domain-containing protein n=1 Tax=Yasminevirus sp. GU-2018 TaxID=2420051 RepID=A0A5K0U9Z1_9VIRU|nr:hypothetical protein YASMINEVIRUS_1018 [Yasminevirus sp. GU-2018]